MAVIDGYFVNKLTFDILFWYTVFANLVNLENYPHFKNIEKKIGAILKIDLSLLAVVKKQQNSPLI